MSRASFGFVGRHTVVQDRPVDEPTSGSSQRQRQSISGTPTTSAVSINSRLSDPGRWQVGLRTGQPICAWIPSRNPCVVSLFRATTACVYATFPRFVVDERDGMITAAARQSSRQLHASSARAIDHHALGTVGPAKVQQAAHAEAAAADEQQRESPVDRDCRDGNGRAVSQKSVPIALDCVCRHMVRRGTKPGDSAGSN